MAQAAQKIHVGTIEGYCGGEPHILGRRIKVRDVAIWHDRLGMSADQIASEYDLDLSQIYAALTYYFDNREQIDKTIRESEAFIAELEKRETSSIQQKINGLRGD